MINPNHLRALIVDPSITLIGHYSKSASDLIMGTFAKETLLGYYLKQYPTGPGLGLGQMEPKSGELVVNWVRANCALREIEVFYAAIDAPIDSAYGHSMSEKMIYNLRVQTIFTRYLYLSIKEPLPKKKAFNGKAAYILALGEYWDKYYNRNPKHGTAHEFLECYYKYVEGE